MSSTSMNSNLTNLIALGEGVYISKPRPKTKEASSSFVSTVPAPTVVLLFTWMGAKLSHIVKYVQAYDNLYPEAAKIVVRSEASFFWSSTKAKRAYLAPVVEALELLGCLPPAVTPISKSIYAASIDPIVPYPTPGVLVHTFSNGGSWQLTTLSEILSERATSRYYATPAVALPASAVILDSCPGNGGPDKTVRAFARVIRSPALRVIVNFLIRSLFVWLSVRARIATLFALILPFARSKAKQDNVIDQMKARLNFTQLLPWLGPRTRRLYVYSEADDLIPAAEVEAHAADAKEKGLEVRMEKFDGSPHVAHARTHPERYWGAVKKIWEDACMDAGNI